MSARNTVISGFKIDIYNQWFESFPKNAKHCYVMEVTHILISFKS